MKIDYIAIFKKVWPYKCYRCGYHAIRVVNKVKQRCDMCGGLASIGPRR